MTSTSSGVAWPAGPRNEKVEVEPLLAHFRIVYRGHQRHAVHRQQSPGHPDMLPTAVARLRLRRVR